MKHVVEDHKDVRCGDWNNKEVEVINPLMLLTAKPVIYLVNLSEADYIRKKNKWLAKIHAWVQTNNAGDMLIPFSGALESRVSNLGSIDWLAYLQDKVTARILTDCFSYLNVRSLT